MKKKQSPRNVAISFTKISEDVLVPTWQIETDKGNKRRRKHPFKSFSFIWWGLAGFWLLSILITPEHLRLQGIPIISFMVIILAIGFFFLMNLPLGFWLELNRTDGYVTCWKSPKKDKLFCREHIDNLLFQADRRWHSSGPKGQTSEYRFYIDLLYKNSVEKKKRFCTVFDLFSDDKIMAEPDWEDFFLSGALAHRIDAFIRDFMSGNPLPVSTSSTYIFTPNNKS